METTERITSLDLRLFRQSKGLTQSQVAAAMGCARLTIVRIEQRRTLPRPETARRVMDAVVRAEAERDAR